MMLLAAVNQGRMVKCPPTSGSFQHPRHLSSKSLFVKNILSFDSTSSASSISENACLICVTNSQPSEQPAPTVRPRLDQTHPAPNEGGPFVVVPTDSVNKRNTEQPHCWIA